MTLNWNASETKLMMPKSSKWSNKRSNICFYNCILSCTWNMKIPISDGPIDLFHLTEFFFGVPLLLVFVYMKFLRYFLF